MRTLTLLILAFWVSSSVVLAKPPEQRREVQRHGVEFEQWISETFFGGYQPKDYTQLWDIPAEVNTRYGGIPVNPKAVKFGAPVDLGDALRQFDITEPFLLIVGFWQQDGDRKRFVNVQAVRVEPEQWRRLWAPVARADLAALDVQIKDASRPLAEARQAAQSSKRRAPFSQAVMQVNPKLDARQRRLQCSLRFDDFFAQLAPTASRAATNAPTLFGQALPEALVSPPRNRQREPGRPAK